MRIIVSIVLVTWCGLVCRAAVPQSLPASPSPAPALPPPGVPRGLGVNIHFTDPRPGEMEQLAAGGFKFVRMDFAWGGIERKKGEYNFSTYERLLAACDKFGLRAVLILDYANALYDGGLSPHTDEGRRAFASFAAAAARHFKGRGVLWEMWNEPNIGFWKPQPDVEAYAKLALATGRAIREAEPGETYVGPATSEVDLKFLEACFKAGLLDYWSAVSVHPYRQRDPETAADDYRKLRLLIARYAPPGKAVPILSGEWGYSSAWKGFDEARQGKYLPRQWLTNLSNDVPLSVWYDWHDDGPDPKEPEHHFGAVHHPYRQNSQGPGDVYESKPAYRAAKALAANLAGYRFNKRLATAKADEYVLLFSKEAEDAAPGEVCLAAWTTAGEPREVVVPASPGDFGRAGPLGEPLPAVTADGKGLALTLHDFVQYWTPSRPNELLAVAARWGRLPLEVSAPAPGPASVGADLSNPLGRPIRVKLGGPGGDWQALEPARGIVSQGVGNLRLIPLTRSPQPLSVRVECEVEGAGRFAQETRVIVTNPLALAPLPVALRTLAVRIDNPSGEAFAGRLALTDLSDPLHADDPGDAPVELKTGETSAVVRIHNTNFAGPNFHFGLRLTDAAGKPALSLPPAKYSRVDNLIPGSPLEKTYSGALFGITYTLSPDGDGKVRSEQTLGHDDPPSGPAEPGLPSLKISYKFDAGWKFLRLVPEKSPDGPGKPRPPAIDGLPRALGLWVYGDGSRNAIRVRFTDSTGQTFQSAADPLDWTGWRYVTFPMDGADSGRVSHWGGANDGRPHPPLRWDALFLIDSAGRKATAGEVYLAGPTLVE